MCFHWIFISLNFLHLKYETEKFWDDVGGTQLDDVGKGQLGQKLEV